jgi:hypothetical protein
MFTHELGWSCQLILSSPPFTDHFPHLIARDILRKSPLLCLSLELPLSGNSSKVSK